MNMILLQQAIEVQFEPVGNWFFALPAAVLFVLLLLVAYGRLNRSNRPGSYRLLVGLRLLAAVIVVLLLVRPSLVISEVRRERPEIVVLQDVSASMSVTDAADGRQRSEALRQVLGEQREAVSRLVRQCQVTAYLFGDELVPLLDPASVDENPAGAAGEAAPGAADGDQKPPTYGIQAPAGADLLWQLDQALLSETGQASTRLGDALKQAADRHSGSGLAAIILITDGRSTLSSLPPKEAAAALARRKVPIYALQLGSADVNAGVRDVAVKNFDLPKQAFIGNRVIVRADLVLRGLEGQMVQVDLLVDGQVRSSQTVEASDMHQVERLELPFDLAAAGEHRLAVRAAAVPGELTLKNNEVHGWLTAVEGGIRVLLVSGTLRTEGLYLSRALRQAGEFELTRVVVSDAASAARLLPAEPAGWAEYNVVILDDVASADLPPAQAESLVRAVGSGSGLIMLGSQQRAYSAGGYRYGPLASVLPVVLGESEPDPLGEVSFLPTAAGFRSRVMQIAPSALESETAWQSLPPLMGAHRFQQVRQTADVLAASAEGEPLLVVGQHDSGRVAALAVDTTYQWVLDGDDDPPGVLHQRFWRQLVMLLAGQEPAGSVDGVVVATDRPRYNLSALDVGRQSVVVSAAATDGRGRAISDATLTLTLTDPQGRVIDVPLDRRRQQSEASLRPQEPGDYLLTLQARRGQEELGTAHCRFIVENPELEFDDPTADAALLAELALSTGGRVYELDEAGLMFTELLERQEKRTALVPVSHELWDHWLVLVAFTGLLATEWVLRKRSSLV